MSTEKRCEQVVAKEFGHPPESFVNSCRARMGRPIANDSEAGRQRAKVSPRKKFKKASLIF
jgi:hypothetical protein